MAIGFFNFKNGFQRKPSKKKSGHILIVMHDYVVRKRLCRLRKESKQHGLISRIAETLVPTFSPSFVSILYLYYSICIWLFMRNLLVPYHKTRTWLSPIIYTSTKSCVCVFATARILWTNSRRTSENNSKNFWEILEVRVHFPTPRAARPACRVGTRPRTK